MLNETIMFLDNPFISKASTKRRVYSTIFPPHHLQLVKGTTPVEQRKWRHQRPLQGEALPREKNTPCHHLITNM